MMRLIARFAALLLVLGWVSAAWAHASLVSVDPGDGSVLSSAPKTVQLRFNENVTPVFVRLIDAQGTARDDVGMSVTDKTIVVTLPRSLPRGTQTVSYRVISLDGHPVGGSVLFSIGAPTSGTPESATSNAKAAGIWMARIGVYLGLLAGVGGAFFCAWISGSPAGSAAVRFALRLGLVSSVLSLGLQGLDVLAIGFADILTLAPWKAALSTSLGPSLVIAVIAMLVGLVVQRDVSGRKSAPSLQSALGRQSAPGRIMARSLSGLAMAAVGLSLAMTGHAASAPPSWLSRPAVFVHGVAAAYWAGALMPLAAMAWSRAEALLPVVSRFSRAAVPVVGVLVLTGLTLAIVQLQSVHALIDTTYGILLSIKLALVVVLLGLAAFNRFRLTPALAIHPQQTQPLVRSLLLECALVLAILGVMAGWRFTPPPRALAAAMRPPLSLHIHTDKAMFQVLVSPGHAGVDAFVLQLMTGEGVPLEAKEATLALSLPQRGIEPFERKAKLGADGYWHVESVPLPYSGRWHIRVEALVSDFEEIALEDDLVVPDR